MASKKIKRCDNEECGRPLTRCKLRRKVQLVTQKGQTIKVRLCEICLVYVVQGEKDGGAYVIIKGQRCDIMPDDNSIMSNSAKLDLMLEYGEAASK